MIRYTCRACGNLWWGDAASRCPACMDAELQRARELEELNRPVDKKKKKKKK